jgi:hypothetical protein
MTSPPYRFLPFAMMKLSVKLNPSNDFTFSF